MSSIAPPPGHPIVTPPNNESVELDAKSAYLFFQVEDSGVGMNPEETGRLFQRFMQASPVTHCEFGGSGLGLFVCRSTSQSLIVVNIFEMLTFSSSRSIGLSELHGGRIEVVSTEGVGSIFRGFIACGDMTALSPSPTVSQSSHQYHVSRDSSTERSMSNGVDNNHRSHHPKLRILAVDDNAVNRRILRRQLEMAGHQVDQAVDGQEVSNLTETMKQCGPHSLIFKSFPSCSLVR
jgi:CheY-like chemotaxis protein